MGAKASSGLVAWIRRRALTAGAAGLIATSILVVPIGAHASNGSVLLLGSTVFNGINSDEGLKAASLGYTVSVVDDATWDSMTTAQFATYSALILGDPDCSGRPSVGAAEANVSTWSAAVNGNISIVGTDPVFHHLNSIPGALNVTDDAVAYALARPGTTGAYISLSCYYAGTVPSTSVAVLSGLGSFFVHGGLNCSDSGHVETNVASGTAWSGLTDADLASWFCSIHETFDQWPNTFKPLAIDPSATPPNFTGSDNIAGQPYILISGQGTCQTSFAVSADSTQLGRTDLTGTCFAPGEKVDVLLNTEAGAVLVDQPTTDKFGAINEVFVLPIFFNIALPHAKGFQSVTVPLRSDPNNPTVYQLDVIGESAGDGGRQQVLVNSDNELVPDEAKAATTSGPGCVPANIAAPAAASPSDLFTNGRWIVQQVGTLQKRVKLASVNWYGAEQADFVVGGLQCQSLATIAAVIQGSFNSVRLPFSNAMLEEDPGSCSVTPAPLEQPCISPGLLLANPSLQSSDALGIYRAVIEALGRIGVMVVLDDHTTDAQWAPGAGNGIWWGGVLWDDLVANANCPSTGDDHCWHRRIALWKNDWITMVNLFQSETNVIGVDLRNEPDDHYSYGIGESWCSTTCIPPSPAPAQPQTITPSAEPSKDEWGASAEWAGNAILSALQSNKQLLIFVEGLQAGADLTKVFSNPLTLQTPDHLVYSPHAYPFFFFGTAPLSYDLAAKVDSVLTNGLGNSWGYIVTQDKPFTAPVWVGEFGDCNVDDSCASSFRDTFIAYLNGADFDWAYWPINATYSDAGTSKPGQSWFLTERFGVLNSNWSRARSTQLLAKLPTACAQGPCP